MDCEADPEVCHEQGPPKTEVEEDEDAALAAALDGWGEEEDGWGEDEDGAQGLELHDPLGAGANTDSSTSHFHPDATAATSSSDVQAPDQATRLLLLPRELLLRAWSFLSADDLCNTAAVCGTLHTLSGEQVLWRRLYCTRWGKPQEQQGEASWKALYRDKDAEERARWEQEEGPGGHQGGSQGDDMMAALYRDMQRARRQQALGRGQVDDTMEVPRCALQARLEAWRSAYPPVPSGQPPRPAALGAPLASNCQTTPAVQQGGSGRVRAWHAQASVGEAVKRVLTPSQCQAPSSAGCLGGSVGSSSAGSGSGGTNSGGLDVVSGVAVGILEQGAMQSTSGVMRAPGIVETASGTPPLAQQAHPQQQQQQQQLQDAPLDSQQHEHNQQPVPPAPPPQLPQAPQQQKLPSQRRYVQPRARVTAKPSTPQSHTGTGSRHSGSAGGGGSGSGQASGRGTSGAWGAARVWGDDQVAMRPDLGGPGGCNAFTWDQIGDHFCCRETGWIHLCDHTCREGVIDPTHDQLVCPISGSTVDRMLTEYDLRCNERVRSGPVGHDEQDVDFAGFVGRAYARGYECRSDRELRLRCGVKLN